ncbi:DUF3060 domain-containing protein [Leucobacter iarius]|uniref:DUF3060 domain-containing protein n=1 Tax=Leucobacter iarius TaxID=333963 RepID=A0ABN2LU98_9MICO
MNTTTQKKSSVLLALAGASVALIALAGCTAPGGSDSAKKDPKPSASAQKESNAKEKEFVPEKKDFTCSDGVAKADTSNAILTLKGDCDAVEVTGVNSLITLEGAVKSVSVGGSINKVVAKQVIETVTFVKDSSGNVVETAAKPKTTDNGTQNEVVAPK